MSRILPLWQLPAGWQPPIVRISGTLPGSQEEQELLARYSGQLRQFYLGARRARSLGVVDQSKSRREFAEGRMTYTSQMGQEIVELELRPERGPQPRPAADKTPWDWALVEFDLVVPNTSLGSGLTIRNSLSGGTPYMRGELVLDPETIESSTLASFNTQEVLRFPTGVEVVFPAADAMSTGAWKSSLLLDLRPFRGMSIIEADVYGAIKYDQAGQIGWGRRAWTGDEINAEYGPGGPSYIEPISLGTFRSVYWAGPWGAPSDSHEYFDADEISSTASPLPSTLWPFTPGRTGFSSTPGVDFTPVGVLPPVPEPSHSPPSVGFPGRTTWRQEYITLDPATGLVDGWFQWGTGHGDYLPGGTPGVDHVVEMFQRFTVWGRWHIEPREGFATKYAQAPVIVTGRTFKGAPEWGGAQHDASDQIPDTRTWEIVPRYPDRPPLPIVSTECRTPADGDNDDYMGRITVDLELGVIAFRPA